MLYLFEFEDSEFLWDGDEAWSGLLWSSFSLTLPSAESNMKHQDDNFRENLDTLLKIKAPTI